MNIILLGPPGAGKGTQAKRLETLLRAPHVASGDIFRDIRREDSPKAREVQGYMDRGEYVPDDLTIDLVLDRLRKPDAHGGFILDGFPRTQGQAEALDRAMADEGSGIQAVLFITAPNEILMRRLAGRIICPQCHAIYNVQTKRPRVDNICDVCGHRVERRTDEDPTVVTKRLLIFLQQTKPLVEYYRQGGNLIEIDGARPPDVVEADIDEQIGIRPARAADEDATQGVAS